jgi:hypothetical protein
MKIEKQKKKKKKPSKGTSSVMRYFKHRTISLARKEASCNFLNGLLMWFCDCIFGTDKKPVVQA